MPRPLGVFETCAATPSRWFPASRQVESRSSHTNVRHTVLKRPLNQGKSEGLGSVSCAVAVRHLNNTRQRRDTREMGLTGMVLSTIAIAAGAIMYWAETTQGHGFRLSTVGVILMVVGAVGLVNSTVVFAVSRRPAGGRNRTYDKQVTDTPGRTAEVHEEGQ